MKYPIHLQIFLTSPSHQVNSHYVLKIAEVVPVCKKDSKLDYQNYRPISLLSNIKKILEKMIYKHLYKFFNDNNILCELQFGFRQNFSTTHASENISP